MNGIVNGMIGVLVVGGLATITVQFLSTSPSRESHPTRATTGMESEAVADPPPSWIASTPGAGPASPALPLVSPSKRDEVLTIGGRVLDRDSGRVVPRFFVHCQRLQDSANDDSAREDARAMTLRGEDGTFSLAELPPGNYRLTFESADRVTEVRKLVSVPLDRSLVIEMHHGPHIRGRVIGADGQPVSQMSVTLLVSNGGESFVPRKSCRTNREGEYLFPRLDPGEYWVHAGSSAGPRSAMLGVAAEAVRHDFFLRGLNALECTVLDEAGVPIEGARVTVRGEGEYRRAVTDLAGRVELASLSACQYAVKVSRRGYQPGESAVEVSADGHHRVLLRLEPVATDESTGGA